jgi:predicted ester cyclase
MDDLAAFYRRYNALCNEHRFHDLPEFVAPDVVINGTDHGLVAYAGGLVEVVRAFPDYRWEVQHMLAEPPWLAVRLHDTGTHRNPFKGVPPTGRAVSTPEFAFYRIEDGLIREVWGTPFALALLHQVR